MHLLLRRYGCGLCLEPARKPTSPKANRFFHRRLTVIVYPIFRVRSSTEVSTPARLQMVRTLLAIRSPNNTIKSNHSQSRTDPVGGAFRRPLQNLRLMSWDITAGLQTGSVSCRQVSIRHRHKPDTFDCAERAFGVTVASKLQSNESCDQTNSKNHRSDPHCIASVIRVSWIGSWTHRSSPFSPPANCATDCPSRSGVSGT